MNSDESENPGRQEPPEQCVPRLEPRNNDIASHRASSIAFSYRVWLFRLVSVVLGLSIFGLIELVCVGFGWGESQIGDDPLVGFNAIRPLFEKTADGQEFHTSPARRGYFKEVSFAATKPDDEFRIFVFGGSTVQGNPFSIETSFPTYLQIALDAADASRNWKVVNCGGVSYASYRLLPVMRECLEYRPDLYVFCGGHNQFLEHISFEDVRESAAVTAPSLSVLNHLRSFRILQRTLKGSGHQKVDLAREAGVSRAILPAEVNTMLDQHDGMANYHRDDKLASQIAASFAGDLRSMSRLSREANVALLFVLPPSNLCDCPPFKSEFSDTTSAEVQSQIITDLKQARQLAANDLSQAIAIAQRVTAKDQRYALAWYELGQLQLTAKDFSGAASSLRRAKDEDICPLRITTPLENGMRDVALQESVPLIDADELLTRRCKNGIAGDGVLVDHVHPSFRGHEDIAVAIADWMISTGLATASNVAWKEDAVSECRDQLSKLDDLYFLRGQRALRSLRLWVAGRAIETPLVPRDEETGKSAESR